VTTLARADILAAVRLLEPALRRDTTVEIAAERQRHRTQALAPLARPADRPGAPVLVEGTNRLPRIWAVLCYRAGENAQILALAEALGWPFEIKRLVYPPGGRLLDVWRGTTVLGIDRARSSPLNPPWPELVISAGMRNEPVCRWIRAASGGYTRYVHIGKPWAPAERFDLVVTVPEYHVPVRPNVIHNQLSLHRVNPGALAAAAAAWGPRLAHLPRPYVAVLAGGYGGPYCFDAEKAARLGREASGLAARMGGGSLLVSTSARTSSAAASALAAAITRPTSQYHWRPDDPDNPYLGYLALADAIVVTCDSATMLAEACATRKPVHMFDLLTDDPAPRGQTLSARLRCLGGRCNLGRLQAFLYRKVFWGGLVPRYLVRDVRRVHEQLLASGRVAWLGTPAPSQIPSPLDEMGRTVARVRAVFAAGPDRRIHSYRLGSARSAGA
jgi:mitochondrial fission protein ELM1